ncbi:D-glycero-beta-D-manno-heptose 1-phosphate adenylyltransferase [Armatimonadetes bacterium Uphvl-Ar1]|nr:D-glycero-beta-D-manno-heptose 1-phosphate adenylyltransferase [Armatimonadetes bacterium Uphvl-Ar1]
MSPEILDTITQARQGRTLVFTNGVFDILHAGHVTYLEQAKTLGDLLVVALNSDQSVKNLNKAPNRPINNLEDRLTIIRALRCVDFAISFSDNTPENLISLLKPDIHVKGGDYTPEKLPETKIVRSYGGEVIILPFLTGRSTTSILDRLTSQPGD